MVYLIHFDKKYKHSLHYIGFSKDKNFLSRMDYHRSNQGSRLIRAVNLAGIGWNVVRTWPDMDGNFERHLKTQKNSYRFCPVCMKINEKLTPDQRTWIDRMLHGCGLEAGIRNFNKQQLQEMEFLVKYNLAYEQKSSVRVLNYFIPDYDRERIQKLIA